MQYRFSKNVYTLEWNYDFGGLQSNEITGLRNHEGEISL